jgi:hypothetical protein
MLAMGRAGRSASTRSPRRPIETEKDPARFPDASRVTRLAHKKTILGKPGIGAHFLSFYFPTTLI